MKAAAAAAAAAWSIRSVVLSMAVAPVNVVVLLLNCSFQLFVRVGVSLVLSPCQMPHRIELHDNS